MGRKYCEKMEVFSLALKDNRVELCLRSCGSEFQMLVQSKRNVDDTSVSLALNDPDRRAAILNSDLEKN